MRPGEVLAGRYTIEAPIGHGGMAEVFAATDEVLGRQVAVKVLLDRFLDDELFIERFRQEAQASASLNHPNIVAVFDTGEHMGIPFIVMELVRGRSLQDVIAAGGLTEHRALEVLSETCAALQYAHDRGLVHRDVKPGNILVGDDGTVKVTDFGIARAIDAETVTQTAAILGTAAYLSPEQAQGQMVDARSDVYSLGVVMYELLTSQQPFVGDTPVGVAYMHVQELARPPREWDATIAESSEAIAMKALAKNPANRYQSAHDMRADVAQALVGGGISAPAVMGHDETAVLDAQHLAGDLPDGRARRQRTVGYVLLAIASIGAAAFAVVLLMNALGGDPVNNPTVPSVIGMTTAEARAALDARGLVAVPVNDIYSDDVVAGRVAEQRPAKGNQVATGTVVELSISLGAELIGVPDIKGFPEEEGLKALRDADLVPGDRSTEFSDEFAAGVVLRTLPAAGDRVARRTRIAYVVSAGEELVRVPPVEGATESDARFALDDDFEVLVVREFSDTIAEGVVIRQDPRAGTELPRGADVTIVVSKGPKDGQEPAPEPSPSGSSGGVPSVLPTEPGN